MAMARQVSAKSNGSWLAISGTSRVGSEQWFYPGHGNDSTLGAERPHVAEWRSRGW